MPSSVSALMPLRSVAVYHVAQVQAHLGREDGTAGHWYRPRCMATPPTDVTSFGAAASGCGLPMPADSTAKKTGGCDTHAAEHGPPTVRLGGSSNQRMGAGLDALVAAPGHHCRIDQVRQTRRRITPPDARHTYGPPTKGRGAYPKLLGTLLATVAAAPVALAVRGFRGTSSPKTVGRALVFLAMLSTASAMLPSEQSEAPEMTITGNPNPKS